MTTNTRTPNEKSSKKTRDKTPSSRAGTSGTSEEEGVVEPTRETPTRAVLATFQGANTG